MEHHFEFGDWTASCLPEDGGRLTRLQFHGTDLLTPPPSDFRPPTQNHGRYETRPVFGYDDCFPTVDPCSHPDTGDALPDHGEFCWQGWTVHRTDDSLSCETQSRLLPVRFRRELRFQGATLTWHFEAENHGPVPVRVLHVMHALLPRGSIINIALPARAEVIEETRTGFPATDRLVDLEWGLLALPPGRFVMLLLRHVRQGRVKLTLTNATRLEIEFPADLFPTLGIWWNHGGYPDEDGLRRSECAFEPIPGLWSSLERSCAEGPVLEMPASGRKIWDITWRVES